jgi:hypothetical protein
VNNSLIVSMADIHPHGSKDMSLRQWRYPGS